MCVCVCVCILPFGARLCGQFRSKVSDILRPDQLNDEQYLLRWLRGNCPYYHPLNYYNNNNNNSNCIVYNIILSSCYSSMADLTFLWGLFRIF